jgi:hypothetical protein
MPRKILTTTEQLEKLNKLELLAKQAAESEDLVVKLGAVDLYAGLVEFYTIQEARLVEQIILKSQLAEGKKPTFEPKSSSWFYDRRISTRGIVKEINRLLPFKGVNPESSVAADKLNALAKELIDETEKFLNYRNTIIHHLASPKFTLTDMSDLCNKTVSQYKNVIRAHTAFMETGQPYRFGEKELQHFYLGK